MGTTGSDGPGRDTGQDPVPATRTGSGGATAGPRRPPVPADLTGFRSADFAYDTTSLEHFQRLIDTVPTGPRGMRWIHQPDAVLCQADRELDSPYDDFVAKVDIASVGRRFKDVVSSTIEVLRRDSDGRATLQLELITIWQRPHVAFWLERIDYGPDEQRIWIRTIHSFDGPTAHHDGYLAFSRVTGRTRIALLACRRFAVPRALTLFHLDRWPWLTRILAESASRRFVDVTTANIIASYRGRDVCGGHQVGAGDAQYAVRPSGRKHPFSRKQPFGRRADRS